MEITPREMETKTDNEIIAEFMPKSGIFYLDPTNGVTLCEANHLEYFKRWDWLMPVVEKIESLSIGVQIVGNYTSMYAQRNDGRGTNCVSNEAGETKIKSVYKAVVEFIKWYNSQDTSNQPKKQ